MKILILSFIFGVVGAYLVNENPTGKLVIVI